MTNCSWIETSTPEEQGIPSRAISDFLRTVWDQGQELHSLHVVRNGKLVAAGVAKPFTEDSYHRIFSAAKGIVAAAVLFAIQDGYFGMDDLVVPYLLSHMPEDYDPRWDSLTVYHLLTMTAGHDKPVFPQGWSTDDWVKTFFAAPPAYAPGEFWFYDIGNQTILNALILETTGQNTDEFLRLRLFAPLGITTYGNYTKLGLFNSSSFHLKPADMAKLALFYLQEGAWNGRQLLRRDLARSAGVSHVPNPRPGMPLNGGSAGYCLHMWRNLQGGYRLDGGQGQYGIVLPDMDLAVGMMAALSPRPGMRSPVDLFLEAMLQNARLRPLPPDPAGLAELRELLENWSLAPRGTAAPGADYGGSYGAVSEDSPIRRLELTFLPDLAEITAEYPDGSRRAAPVGLGGTWLPGRDYLFQAEPILSFPDPDAIYGYDPRDSLRNGAWTGPDTFTLYERTHARMRGFGMELAFTPEGLTVTLEPEGRSPRKLEFVKG